MTSHFFKTTNIISPGGVALIIYKRKKLHTSLGSWEAWARLDKARELVARLGFGSLRAWVELKSSLRWAELELLASLELFFDSLRSEEYVVHCTRHCKCIAYIDSSAVAPALDLDQISFGGCMMIISATTISSYTLSLYNEVEERRKEKERITRHVRDNLDANFKKNDRKKSGLTR